MLKLKISDAVEVEFRLFSGRVEIIFELLDSVSLQEKSCKK